MRSDSGHYKIVNTSIKFIYFKNGVQIKKIATFIEIRVNYQFL